VPPTAGYSGTPLSKKMSFKECSLVFLVDAPKDYARLVAPMPVGVEFISKPSGNVDIAHIFVSRRSEVALPLGFVDIKVCAVTDIGRASS
jgi:hypothetical protein